MATTTVTPDRPMTNAVRDIGRGREGQEEDSLCADGNDHGDS